MSRHPHGKKQTKFQKKSMSNLGDTAGALNLAKIDLLGFQSELVSPQKTNSQYESLLKCLYHTHSPPANGSDKIRSCLKCTEKVLR